MKATVTLIEPEEHLSTDVDSWARMMFERNATKHGLPSVPMREAAGRFPESYMCICAYYALRRHGQISLSYEEFENRWGGVEFETADEDPTSPAPSAG